MQENQYLPSALSQGALLYTKLSTGNVGKNYASIMPVCCAILVSACV